MSEKPKDEQTSAPRRPVSIFKVVNERNKTANADLIVLTAQILSMKVEELTDEEIDELIDDARRWENFIQRPRERSKFNEASIRDFSAATARILANLASRLHKEKIDLNSKIQKVRRAVEDTEPSLLDGGLNFLRRGNSPSREIRY